MCVCVRVCAHVSSVGHAEFIRLKGHPSWEAYWVAMYMQLGTILGKDRFGAGGEDLGVISIYLAA